MNELDWIYGKSWKCVAAVLAYGVCLACAPVVISSSWEEGTPSDEEEGSPSDEEEGVEGPENLLIMLAKHLEKVDFSRQPTQIELYW